MMIELMIYTFLTLLVLSFGFLLAFKTKRVQEINWKIHSKLWFYSKTKYGRKLLERMQVDNNKKWFLLEQKIVGFTFICISLVAVYILIRKWLSI